MTASQPSSPQSPANWVKAARLPTNFSEMTAVSSTTTLMTPTTTTTSKEKSTTQERQCSTIPEPPKPKKKPASKFKDTLWQLGICILSLGLFAVIVLFVQVSKYAQQDSRQKKQLDGLLRTNASVTLAVLRTAQAVLSTLTMLGLDNALEHIQWTLMNTETGLPFSSLLALSPATSQIGMLRLFFCEGALMGARLWTLLRGSLTFCIWMAGMVLWYNTNLMTVYDTAYTYNVSAGIGPFNASLVSPFLDYLQGLSPSYPYTVLPYTYYAAAYTLVLNPLIATIVDPVACTSQTSGDCMSYLFTGGLEMVAPWVSAAYTDYPMVKVDAAPAVQMDFSGVLTVDQRPFAEADCDVYGDAETTIGIQLCVEEESVGTLRSGLFLCNGTQGGTACLPFDNSQGSLNITTRLSMYTRRATFVAARANYSIVSIAQTSSSSSSSSSSAATTPSLVTDLDVPAYRAALAWLLNYTAAGIPGPSSLAESFWSSSLQLGGGPATYGILTQNFQSLLAFPTWLFNANNWGNTALRSNVLVQGVMPPEFYTTAEMVRPVSTYDFDSGMFGLFVGLQGVAIVFIWAVLLWVWGNGLGGRELPETSAFPIFDVKYRTKVEGEGLLPAERLAGMKGEEVVQSLRGAVVRTVEGSKFKEEGRGTFRGPREVRLVEESKYNRT